jgi:N-acetylmuramic acid 6-phosphate etherase
MQLIMSDTHNLGSLVGGASRIRRSAPIQWLAGCLLAANLLWCSNGLGQQTETPREQALHFIKDETQFHLGYLPTEQSHPKTRGLSQALQTNTAQAVSMLLSVDDDIPPVTAQVFAGKEFAQMRAAIKTALDRKRRVYFSGCGATGRLAILLDAANRRFWRETFEKQPGLRAVCGDMAERTSAVMTGGDFALVRSVEMFEDFSDFGYHQIRQAGIRKGDVLIAISEGGETSSVIGTVWRGVDAKARVFFLFNNPADLLAAHLDRCRKVVENDAVTKLVLCTGPMAVAGSTRMQATTIEMLVAGTAFEMALADHLKSRLTPAQFAGLGLADLTPEKRLAQFQTLLQQLRTQPNIAALARMVDDEADLYSHKGRITYFASDYLLDIFTDTTERSPTFKIPPFRSTLETAAPASWAFVKDPVRPTPSAWLRLLEHAPRCLEWKTNTYVTLKAPAKLIANPPQIGRDRLNTYLIGNEPDASRTEVKPNTATAVLIGGEASLLNDGSKNPWRRAFLSSTTSFDQRSSLVIGRTTPSGWKDQQIHVDVDIPETPLQLFAHLGAKLVLNNVSSATMGKMGRLTGNWMAHVDASNKKLIDRSTRLVSELAGVDYDTACIALFESIEEMKTWDEPRRKTTSPAAYTIEKFRSGKSVTH